MIPNATAWRRTCCAALLVFVWPLTATAQYRQDGHNDEQISISGHYTVSAVGFYYTPATSYWLNRVETYFSKAAYYPGCCGVPVERPVTLEVLTAARSDGGALLRSATFKSLDASGQFGGPSFQPLFLSAGTTYFIGFLNVLALGANLSYEATTPHQIFRFDWPEPFGITGQYVETQNLFDQGAPNIGPLLRFSGTAALGRPDPTVVPEPSTFALTFLGTLLLVGRRVVPHFALPRLARGAMSEATQRGYSLTQNARSMRAWRFRASKRAPMLGF